MARNAQTIPAQSGRQVIPVDISKGMYAAGDGSRIPDGYAQLVADYVIRPNRIEMRPPCLTDALAADVVGYMVWEDLVNQKTRFLALVYSVGFTLYTKQDGSETWVISATPFSSFAAGARLLSYTNLNGKLFFMMDDGTNTMTPGGAGSWDGTTLSVSPFNSAIYGRAVAAFGDRLFIAGPVATISALGTATTNSYDWSNGTNWKMTSVNVSFATLGSGVKVCRLSPTSVAANACSAVYNPIGAGLISVPANTSNVKYVWRGDFRGNDPIYRVPYTLEWAMVSTKSDTTAYVLGDMVVSAGYRYRCTTAGTTGVGVVLGTTVGGTTVDGTATWTNEGTDTLNGNEDRFFTSVDGWVPASVECSVPARTNAVYITPRLKFYNSSFTACTTLSAVDISLKDGVADGNPAKANKGQQWTLGDYRYPFFNKESSATATKNLEDIIWSEVGDPATIRAINTYSPKEVAGMPTAMKAAGGRLIVFKRRAMWQFSLTADPDNPIQADGPARVGFGCLSPLAIHALEDELFWLGEDEAYRMRVGYAAPTPLCGEAMRETIYDKRTTGGGVWFEGASGGTVHANMALLAIDAKHREVWTYTQQGRFFVLNLATGAWVRHGVSGLFIGQIQLNYNPVTEKVYVSYTGQGGGRFDDTTASSNDTFIGTSPSPTITFRPFQLSAPQYDVVLEEMRVYGKTTAGNAGNSLVMRMSYSYDQGTTQAHYAQGNFFQAGYETNEYAPMSFPAFIGGRSVTATLTTSENSKGAGTFTFSGIDAALNVKRGHFQQLSSTAPIGA